MVAALALVLQVAVAPPPPPTLIVRRGDQATSISVLTPRSAKGPALSGQRLAAAMGGTLVKAPKGHYILTVGDTKLDFTEGVAFVRTDSGVVPLASAPVVVGTTLYLPFSAVADVVSRFVTGFFYDGDKGELRAFDPGARRVVRGTDSSPPTTSRAARGTDNASSTVSSVARRSDKKHLVVVDAGHGGVDPGMKGPLGVKSPWFHEKTITLAVAKLVAKELRARGVDVLMTRTTDTLIALQDRGRIANDAHGDLFVSIHVNASGQRGSVAGRERGYETYFLAEAKTEDARRVERMENEAVKFETGVNAPKDDPLNFIIHDMAQNEHLRESNELAQLIQDGLGRFHPSSDRGVKQANFAVLRGSYMPAVLVEIGFGTNVDEAKYLADPDNELTIARSIATSVVAYLDRVDARLARTKVGAK